MFQTKVIKKNEINILLPVHLFISLMIFEVIKQKGFLCYVISRIKNPTVRLTKKCTGNKMVVSLSFILTASYLIWHYTTSEIDTALYKKCQPR
jgi:hypothetical protein